MRSCWIIWVGLKSNDKHPYKRHTGESQEKRRQPCKDGDRDWSYAPQAQERMELPETEVGKEGLSPRAFR